MKRIKQIADEQGTSKTAIRRLITDEIRTKYIKEENGVIYILAEGEALIVGKIPKRKAKHVPEHVSSCAGTCSDTTPEHTETLLQLHKGEIRAAELGVEVEKLERIIGMMESQKKKDDNTITEQKQQITSLTTALENTTASLNAAHALHAGSLQTQLVLPEDTSTSRWQRLKAAWRG